MTELERWMNDHPPLADALTAEETAALRAKVLARRPKPRVLRGWRLAAAAAALCLVAAGRRSAGAFPPHERRQRDERTGAEIRRGAGRTADRRNQRPHGQCKGAAARAEYTLRILYDVDNARGMEGDGIWCGDTANFTLSSRPRKAPASGSGTYGSKQTSMYRADAAAMPSARGMAVMTASENDTLSCFVDIPLLYEKARQQCEHCISAT